MQHSGLHTSVYGADLLLDHAVNVVAVDGRTLPNPEDGAPAGPHLQLEPQQVDVTRPSFKGMLPWSTERTGNSKYVNTRRLSCDRGLVLA
jgi:hypothetical protein